MTLRQHPRAGVAVARAVPACASDRSVVATILGLTREMIGNQAGDLAASVAQQGLVT